MHSGEIPAPGELFRHAFRRLKTEQDHLFRIAVIPTLLYFLIFVFLRPLEQDLPALLLPLALILIPETLFDVAWLRWILGAGADDPPLPFRWTLRHTGYCGRRLAVRFFLMAAVVPVIVISALFPENLRPIFLSAASLFSSIYPSASRCLLSPGRSTGLAIFAGPGRRPGKASGGTSGARPLPRCPC